MKTLPRRAYALAVLAFAIVIFFAVNIFADAFFTTARIDLTQNGLFTLSQGTRNIIAKLPEPVTLKFYYSKHIAAEYATTDAYAKQVRDLLVEYAALSHGKIVLQDVDPEPFTAEEDEASAAGLSGARTQSGDVVYFGLVGTNSIDGKEIIPYFSEDRASYLEYDISSLLYRLSNPKTPVIGVVSALPLDANAMEGQSGLQLYADLGKTYKTDMLGTDFKSVPANIDALLIVHPAGITDDAMAAIDQFVLGGGHALVFVDPVSDILNRSAPDGAGSTPPSDLAPLFKSWGIAYNPGTVLADRALAQEVSTDSSGGTQMPYPLWLHLTADNFDSRDPVTASLQTLNLATVGVLSPLAGATTTFSPLVTSSDQAELIPRARAANVADIPELMASIVPTHRIYALAARVSGPVKTAFPDRSGLKQSRGPVAVVVMADSDLFDDRLWVRTGNVLGQNTSEPFADNSAFVINALDNLTGSQDLISLRTRGTDQRPFVVVDRLQAAAQAKFQDTAEALQSRLATTEQNLQSLQQGTQGGASGTVNLTPAQQADINRFQRELADTRAELREVQRNLRKDIDDLGAFLAFVNIALVPILLAGFAIVLSIVRKRRRARPSRV